jgi:hypothetical protein
VLHCRACDGETSLTAGTVFQDTRKPLRMWFLAMWFVTSQKNGVSALGPWSYGASRNRVTSVDEGEFVTVLREHQ